MRGQRVTIPAGEEVVLGTGCFGLTATHESGSAGAWPLLIAVDYPGRRSVNLWRSGICYELGEQASSIRARAADGQAVTLIADVLEVPRDFVNAASAAAAPDARGDGPTAACPENVATTLNAPVPAGASGAVFWATSPAPLAANTLYRLGLVTDGGVFIPVAGATFSLSGLAAPAGWALFVGWGAGVTNAQQTGQLTNADAADFNAWTPRDAKATVQLPGRPDTLRLIVTPPLGMSVNVGSYFFG